MKKESTVVQYMYFRFPSNYAIMILPTIFALTSFFLQEQSLETMGNINVIVSQDQINLVASYINLIKITFSVILAFFVTYRWSSSHKDGSYGYFLTQGINRSKYFNLSYLYTMGASLIVSILGFAIISYFGGLRFSIVESLEIIIIITATMLLLVSSSIFIAHFIKIPELAAMILAVLFIGNANFNYNKENMLSRIINPELNLLVNDNMISTLLIFVVSVLLYLISFKMHLDIDVEL